ncbi:MULTISPECIES: hypothetical protein [unclassified Bradyrhizobium]|uniref:hypothetical protein n=1 Tax=unclassified Bradyrhizobium TaxID=2631580 RepID=UPI001FF762B6|nr:MULTISPECIES: hypothetical protein [unclassified Bradyrhizobium]MCK1712909.1 hypothetical protein [Bradyrhizobium sp. 143]MCK1730783.1 hypothetical protein [Bradyrhizobium sp. 142]
MTAAFCHSATSCGEGSGSQASVRLHERRSLANPTADLIIATKSLIDNKLNAELFKIKIFFVPAQNSI